MINHKHPSHKLVATRSAGSSSAKRQAGLSAFGFLLLLVVVAAGISVTLTLGPHYMDSRAVVTVIESINPAIWKGTNKKKMHDAVNKGLKINQIRTLKSKDIVTIEKKKTGSTAVKLNYEVRENMIGNVDVVLVYDKDFSF